MRVDLQLSSGITLMIASRLMNGKAYPTAAIKKGLVMIYEGQELCEEAVGFGVPILKRGLQAIFPGAVELSPLAEDQSSGIRARFEMNLMERIKKSGSTTLSNPILYAGKNVMAAVIRQLPFMRGVLTGLSNRMRSSFAWETIYEPSGLSTYVTLAYTLDTQTGRIRVELEDQGLDQMGVSEVIVMNEQGARFFDNYQDADGLSLSGNEIGCWDPVLANEAAFVSRELGISFRLPQVKGARLYRGRELVSNRLAWAGFGYTFPPGLGHFTYEITVNKLS